MKQTVAGVDKSIDSHGSTALLTAPNNVLPNVVLLANKLSGIETEPEKWFATGVPSIERIEKSDRSSSIDAFSKFNKVIPITLIISRTDIGKFSFHYKSI